MLRLSPILFMAKEIRIQAVRALEILISLRAMITAAIWQRTERAVMDVSPIGSHILSLFRQDLALPHCCRFAPGKTIQIVYCIHY